jgi:hypothetical protein
VCATAEAVVRLDGGKAANSLLRLTAAHSISGDKVKALEYADWAIEAEAGELSRVRQALEKERRKLGSGK